MSSTIAMRLPASRLKSVLFPTLGRPTIATMGSAWAAPAGSGCCSLRSVRLRAISAGLPREAAHLVRVARPVLFDLHEEAQEDLLPEELLDLEAGVGADRL